jgi:hypothetical protein
MVGHVIEDVIQKGPRSCEGGSVQLGGMGRMQFSHGHHPHRAQSLQASQPGTGDPPGPKERAGAWLPALSGEAPPAVAWSGSGLLSGLRRQAPAAAGRGSVRVLLWQTATVNSDSPPDLHMLNVVVAT